MRHDLLYKKERLENCSFVRTVLMCLVVLYHAIVFWTGGWFSVCEVAIPSKPLAYLAKWLNSFHVYGFTLVSGYVFYSLRIENSKYKEYGQFLLNKIKRLIIPFYFVAAIWVIPISAVIFQYDLQTIMSSYIIALNPSQLWFLWMLFWVFTLFWPLSKTFAQKSTVGFLLSISFYFIGVLGSKFIPNAFNIWTGFRFYIFFWVGFELRKREEMIPKKSWFSVLLFIVFCLVFIEKYRALSFSGWIGNIYDLIMHLLGAWGSFELLQSLAHHVDKRGRALGYLSSRTMIVYLFHQQWIYFAILILNGRILPSLNALANFVIAFSASLLMSELLMKNRVLRFLVGEKA